MLDVILSQGLRNDCIPARLETSLDVTVLAIFHETPFATQPCYRTLKMRFWQPRLLEVSFAWNFVTRRVSEETASEDVASDVT